MHRSEDLKTYSRAQPDLFICLSSSVNQGAESVKDILGHGNPVWAVVV